MNSVLFCGFVIVFSATTVKCGISHRLARFRNLRFLAYCAGRSNWTTGIEEVGIVVCGGPSHRLQLGQVSAIIFESYL